MDETLGGWAWLERRSEVRTPPALTSNVRYRACEDLPAVLQLDDLDTIPWGELQHAHGDAADIPGWLRAYASSTTDSERASSSLYGNAFHQGTRYTASPFTIPFFIGLLGRADLRLDIIERLQAMAYGFEESLFPIGYDSVAAEDLQRVIDDSPNKFGIDGAHTHHAVSRAWPHIVPLLDDPSRQVCSETAHLLAYLPEHAEGSVRELRSRLSLVGAEGSPSVLLALGVLGHQHPGLVTLTDITIHDETLEARLASHCARCLLGDRLAIDALIDALGDDLADASSRILRPDRPVKETSGRAGVRAATRVALRNGRDDPESATTYDSGEHVSDAQPLTVPLSLGNLGALYKLFACTVAAVVVAAGCGKNVSPNSAPPQATLQAPQDPPTSATAAGSLTAMDGLVSTDEAAQASELVRSDEFVSELLGEFGGHLTAWQPAELEGETRGAFAVIELTEPISMTPTIVRPEAVLGPIRVEDYVLERVQIGNEMVERYGVAVDLKTMTIVNLAPMAAAPVTSVPPTG